MVLKYKYINYENSKIKLNLDSLEERRHISCLKFAKNGIKNNNLSDLFLENDKIHKMKTRAVQKVHHTNNFYIFFIYFFWQLSLMWYVRKTSCLHRQRQRGDSIHSNWHHVQNLWLNIDDYHPKKVTIARKNPIPFHIGPKTNKFVERQIFRAKICSNR